MKFLIVAVFLGVAALAQGLEFGLSFPEEFEASKGDRIILGTPAVANQFPYQIYQIITLSGGSRITCGASLISTTWAITAAHCLQGATSSTLYFGAIAHANSPVTRVSTNLHVHPSYNSNNLNHDIALMSFTAITVAANIRPIDLSRSTTATYVGQTAIASGFGYTANNGPVSSTLNYVNLNVITNAVCQNTFGSSVIISSTICAAGISSSAAGVCSGDSGGPLAIGTGTSAILVGVVSFVSSAGCSSSAPSGFVRPNHYLSWINSVSGV